MLTGRHRINLSFLHFILYFTLLCKTIRFWRVILCKYTSPLFYSIHLTEEPEVFPIDMVIPYS